MAVGAACDPEDVAKAPGPRDDTGGDSGDGGDGGDGGVGDGGDGGDGGGDVPAPWEGLDPVALDPLRPFLRVTLPQATAPDRLASLGEVPFTFVLDPGFGTAWVLDSRYRHDPSAWCVDLAEWPELDPDGSRQGTCREGCARIQRGDLSPNGGLVALAADPAGQAVWTLHDNGMLGRASADPIGNPLDLLRLAQVGTVPLVGPGPSRLVADGAGGLLLSDGASLRRLDGAGKELGRVDLAATELTLVDGVAWALAEGGLWTWEGEDLALAVEADTTGGRLADGLATLPAEGLLVDLATGVRAPIEGLTGPVARDDGRTWVAVTEGLARVVDGAVAARHTLDPVLDLRVQGTGEVAALHDDGTVGVYGDETALPGPAPLGITLVAFLEDPKEGSVAWKSCDGGVRTIDAAIRLATQARVLLDDLPAPTALGIIPAVTEATLRCELEEELRGVWEGERIAPGLFFRDETKVHLPDWKHLEDLLVAQAEGHEALGIPITWTRGADRYEGDWVQAIEASGLPLEVIAPDLAAWAQVDAADPRSKDPLPWFNSEPRTAWHPTGDDVSPLLQRPGNSIALFDLSGCPNTWIRECKQLNLGGLDTIDQDDIDVLALDLFRALAVRSQDGPDNWSFHLPALGAFDYTVGCTVRHRRWEGEDCQAARVQDFLLDVQARYVDAGLATWWLPEG